MERIAPGQKVMKRGVYMLVQALSNRTVLNRFLIIRAGILRAIKNTIISIESIMKIMDLKFQILVIQFEGRSKMEKDSVKASFQRIF